MTDIVERLRVRCTAWENAGTDIDQSMRGDMLEAADEIERLRAENEHLKLCSALNDTAATAEIERLRAENKKLREELNNERALKAWGGL